MAWNSLVTECPWLERMTINKNARDRGGYARVTPVVGWRSGVPHVQWVDKSNTDGYERTKSFMRILLAMIAIGEAIR
eukprot:scaffold2441_cov121-Isochrysis_galbana.AAC.5